MYAVNMKNTHKVGDVAEAKILAALIDKYDAVLTPFGNGQRYDLVVEDNGKFLRVQVKNGRVRKGGIVFNSKSFGPRAPTRGYVGEADLFAVWCPELNKAYVVPVDSVPVGYPTLRIDPIQANEGRVRWAKDYEILEGEPDGRTGLSC